MDGNDTVKYNLRNKVWTAMIRRNVSSRKNNQHRMYGNDTQKDKLGIKKAVLHV